MTDKPNTAEVTQADRDFASSYLRARSIVTFREAQAIIDGAWDETPHVLEVANHRLASRPDDRPTSVGERRITRDQYPEIIQAARWMDEDNGTPHFEPGVGFILDDIDGLTVPARWLPHLDAIEAALAALDHAAPHPLDADTLEWLVREGKGPSLYESAARCFVCGEHTPMTAMAASSEALWIANRFFNERFEDWHFDPAVGYVLAAAPAMPDDRPTSVGELQAGLQGARDVLDAIRFRGTQAVDLTGAVETIDAILATAPAIPVGGDQEEDGRARLDKGASDALGEPVWTTAKVPTSGARDLLAGIRERRAARDASGEMYVEGSIYEGMEASLQRSGRTVAHVVRYADAVEIAAILALRPTSATEGEA